MHKEGRIKYVPHDNKYMLIAKEYARNNSLDKNMPNASILVNQGKVIGAGANGSIYHELYGCERIRLNSRTGKDYDRCEGCSPNNHSEAKAITNANTLLKGKSIPENSVMYLWGHWWSCKSCWNAMVTSRITTLALLENSNNLFNKDSQQNIIKNQFSL